MALGNSVVQLQLTEDLTERSIGRMREQAWLHWRCQKPSSGQPQQVAGSHRRVYSATSSQTMDIKFPSRHSNQCILQRIPSQHSNVTRNRAYFLGC